MKTLLTAALFLISITANSQQINDKETGVAINLSAGIANNGYSIGRFGVGVATLFSANTRLHSSVNLQVFSNMRSSSTPVMPELREGIMLGTWELYGGIGYHYASYDKNIGNVNGWRPAYGIEKKFKRTPFTITASCSGRYYSIQIGISAIR